MRFFFFFSSRRRHTRLVSDWSSDVCSSDLTSGTAGAQDIAPRIEVGPQVTQLYVPARTVGSVTYQPAVGAICSVKIKGNLVGFDSSFSFTPKTPNESTAFAGGRLTQAFFGIRVGISKGRLHLYAKVRPGFASGMSRI